MKLSSEKFIVFMATGAYTGKAPFAPGTFGTLAAIPLVLIFSLVPVSFLGILMAGFIGIGIYYADKASVLLENKDPKEVVIDEILGYMTALFGIALSPASLFAGFILFRFFDILKPGPVGWAEKNFDGGTGIVYDDIIAGIISNLILRLFF